MRTQPVAEASRGDENALGLGVEPRRQRFPRLRGLEDRWNARATEVPRPLDHRAGGRAEHHDYSRYHQKADHQADHDVQHRFLAYALTAFRLRFTGERLA